MVLLNFSGEGLALSVTQMGLRHESFHRVRFEVLVTVTVKIILRHVTP